MSLNRKARPPFSFDTWGLLFKAVLKFNYSQEQIGGEAIDTIPYLKVGKKVEWFAPYWVLNELNNKILENEWKDFITNPENKVIFTEAQLRGEEEI